jgi:hypothetical protein
MLSACGGDDRPVGDNGAADGTNQSSGGAPPAKGKEIKLACDLAGPELVTEVFGGTAVKEPVILAESQCAYRLTGGAAEVVLLTYQGSSGNWPGIKAAAENTNQVIQEVDGIGEDAILIGNTKNPALTVAAGAVIFSVGVLDPTPTSAEKVLELGKRIADDVR